MRQIINEIPPESPILIAGPTASGKSALALEIATTQGGVIVNGDALQVYANWRVLTARPSPAEEARAPHALYGHIAGDVTYSVGAWLRDVAPYLKAAPRPIIVGGTGLNFSALTEGLAEIPATPKDIRARANALLEAEGLDVVLAQLDLETRARIDQHNPARALRAWEVLQTTGRGLAAWQDDTPPPLLPRKSCTALVLNTDRDWLRARISQRFDLMLKAGALEEARANLAGWDPSATSAKAIGAQALIDHLTGSLSLEDARQQAITASHQYAKRQRSWFRSRMKGWTQIALP